MRVTRIVILLPIINNRIHRLDCFRFHVRSVAYTLAFAARVASAPGSFNFFIRAAPSSIVVRGKIEIQFDRIVRRWRTTSNHDSNRDRFSAPFPVCSSFMTSRSTLLVPLAPRPINSSRAQSLDPKNRNCSSALAANARLTFVTES